MHQCNHHLPVIVPRPENAGLVKVAPCLRQTPFLIEEIDMGLQKQIEINTSSRQSHYDKSIIFALCYIISVVRASTLGSMN